jgi:hypothetical protein
MDWPLSINEVGLGYVAGKAEGLQIVGMMCSTIAMGDDMVEF